MFAIHENPRGQIDPPWRVVRTPGGYRVADSKGVSLVYISGENQEARRSILNLPKVIVLLPELMTDKPQGSPLMSTEGVEFLERWIEKNVTREIKYSVDGDAASLAIELTEKAIYDAGLSGSKLDDLEHEFRNPEILIHEALESSEGSPGDQEPCS